MKIRFRQHTQHLDRALFTRKVVSNPPSNKYFQRQPQIFVQEAHINSIIHFVYASLIPKFNALFTKILPY